MRLNQLIAQAGICSRRKADILIQEGRVRVDHQVVTDISLKLDPYEHQIHCDQKLLRFEKRVYFLLNKPTGVICSNVGKGKKATDFIPYPHKLFTVGRLDKDSSGALIITNDGNFAHQLIHPSQGFTKEYLIKTSQEITANHLKALSAGVWIEGHLVKPVKVIKVRRGNVKITLREGKKHEVRLLAQQAHLNILELIRIRVGPFVLGGLHPGEYRVLSRAEIDHILDPQDSKSV